MIDFEQELCSELEEMPKVKYAFGWYNGLPRVLRFDRFDLINTMVTLDNYIKAECVNLFSSPVRESQLLRVPSIPWNRVNGMDEDSMEAVSYLSDLTLPEALDSSNDLYDPEFKHLRDHWMYQVWPTMQSLAIVALDAANENNPELEFRTRLSGVKISIALFRQMVRYYVDRKETYVDNEF